MQHFDLNNGMVFIIAEAAGGVYNADQIKAICAVAEEESAFLKISDDQRLGFMIAPDRIGDVQKILSKSGILLRSYRRGGPLSPKACLGELCPQKEQDALSDSIELGRHLAKSFGSDKPFVSIGMNGCSQACTGSAVDDIHIVGEVSGYKITLGGKSSEMPQTGQFLAENISKENLPEVIAKVLTIFYENAGEDEHLHDVVERLGMSLFTEAISDSPSQASEGPEATESVVPDELTTDDIAADELTTDDIAADELTTDDIAASESLSLDEPLVSEDAMAAESSPDSAPLEMSAGDDALELEELPAESSATLALDDEPAVDDFAMSSEESELEATNENSNAVADESELLTSDDTSEFVEAKESHSTVEDDSFLTDETTPAVASTELEGLDEPLIPTDDIEIEEATADDVDTMTRTIRSEMELEEQFAQKAEALPISKPSLATSAPQTPRPQTRAVKFKFYVQDDHFVLSMGNGVECRVPSTTLDASDSFEFEIAGSSVTLIKDGETLEVQVNGVSMTVPLDKEALVA